MEVSLLLSFLIIAIFIGVPTAKGDVNFDLSTATAKTYTKFIEDFRATLPFSHKVYDIPLLYSTISDSRRFILLNLTSYAYETISVAIDVTNVYVVAYRTRDVSYFFKESPPEAYNILFKGTRKITLPYTGNYENLQTAAHKIRENIDLGLPALSSAITTLFYYNAQSAPSALLVLIQTTAEAARFKYIERHVAKYVATNFKPNLAIISLENQWSALSKQIFLAQNQGGKFRNPVDLIKPTGERFQVTNVDSDVVKGNIKLLLNSRASTADENFITTMTLLGESVVN
nr:MAP30 [Momordica charantia]